ncbi:MAG TPA: hypothetical protein VJR30_08955 [Bradyrhizobium sp.]|nr:hypothetical protein [Bradyrhizobium sp.]
MKTRAAKFVAAIIVSILSSANGFAAPESAAPDSAEKVADTCLTSPREYAPPGTRWRYRVERSTGRHCWFLKDDAGKAAGKAAEQSTAAADEPAPPPRSKKAAATRSLSDAHAEFSRTPVEPDTTPAPAQSAPAPAASAAVVESNQPSAARNANMLAPSAASRWPDPMSTVNPAAAPPAPPAPADQGAEARTPPTATPPAKPQAMPRVVPPVPLSEKPMSLPMLITIIAGGLSVLAVLVSVLFAWLASRRNRLAPIAPMPPLEMLDQARRPGDLYRERKRQREKTKRWAA